MENIKDSSFISKSTCLTVCIPTLLPSLSSKTSIVTSVFFYKLNKTFSRYFYLKNIDSCNKNNKFMGWPNHCIVFKTDFDCSCAQKPFQILIHHHQQEPRWQKFSTANNACRQGTNLDADVGVNTIVIDTSSASFFKWGNHQKYRLLDRNYLAGSIFLSSSYTMSQTRVSVRAPWELCIIIITITIKYICL